MSNKDECGEWVGNSTRIRGGGEGGETGVMKGGTTLRSYMSFS